MMIPPPTQIYTVDVTTFVMAYPLFHVYTPGGHAWALRDLARTQGLDPERTLAWVEGDPPFDAVVLREYEDVDWLGELWL